MNLTELENLDTTVWADHYLEPETGELYRQDDRGNWYDISGVRLSVPVFLRDDTLVSLPGKTAISSFAFRGQPIVASPNLGLISVGQMVFDRDLRPVGYFGERLAGLGPGYVDLGGEDVWQEVLLGLDRRAWVNEYDRRPLVINDEEVGAHAGAVQKDEVRYDTWATPKRSYVTADSSTNVIRVAGKPVELDFTTYLRLRELELVRAKMGKRQFFIDLDKREPFTLAAFGDALIVTLYRESIPGRELYDVETEHDSCVFDAEARDIYLLDQGATRPERIEVHPKFPSHLYIATVRGERVICDRASQTIIRLGPDAVQIRDITGQPGDRLLEAISTVGDRIVLDTAEGMDDLRLARVNGHQIVACLDSIHSFGARSVQTVSVRRMGGVVRRMVVVSDPDLPYFTLPDDLKAYNDQAELSIFSGNLIVSVDYEIVLSAGEGSWHPATFLSFEGSEDDVLLNLRNGKPLHLEGEGHRNELVTKLDESTLHRKHWLGEHRMIGAFTLTEDHRRGELLFSANRGRSWLPFYDGYLPIFRRVVKPTVTEEDWDYVLFEIRETGGVGEYVAVEKQAPYRILALEDNLRYVPRIVTKKNRAIVNPEAASQFRRLFLSGATLVDVI